MRILTKPYKVHPYHDLVERGYPWVDKMKSEIENHIDDIMHKMTQEAVFDGQQELLNEQFLYDRFKDNCRCDMRMGNWQVFKYFCRLLYIKVWKDSIGKWCFTTGDAEMYRYFCSMKIDGETNCAPRYIDFHSCDYNHSWVGSRDPWYPIWKQGRRFTFNLVDKFSDYAPVKDRANYFDMFYGIFYCIDDMVSHVRGDQDNDYKDMFTLGHVLYGHQYEDYEVIDYKRRK